MKKVLFALVAACLLVFAPMADAKVLKSKDFQAVEVPDQAAEFYQWAGEIVYSKEFPNGAAYMIVEAYNADETVRVVSLFVRIDGKIYLVGMVTDYKLTRIHYCLQDPGFTKNGKPSGKLIEIPQDQILRISQIDNHLFKGTGV